MNWFGKKEQLSLGRELSFLELRKRTKIVVIDDDENAFPLKKLQEEGYTIDYWRDVESLERLERGDFDIIVLDIGGVGTQLTTRDEGLGVLQYLKARNPAQIIVAFSCEDFNLSKQQFFRMADDAMGKPVDVLKCKQVLDGLIQSKMTVAHYWDTLVALMRSEGISERKISKLRRQLSKAADKREPVEAKELVSGVIENANVAARAASVIAKLLSLFA